MIKVAKADGAKVSFIKEGKDKFVWDLGIAKYKLDFDKRKLVVNIVGSDILADCF